MQKNYKLQKPKQPTSVRFLNFQKEINKLIGIVTNKLYHAYYKLRKYADFKV